MKSHIYLMSNANEPFLKIGKADDVTRRRRALQTSCSAPISMKPVLTVPRDRINQVDQTIKRSLHKHRVKEGGGTEFYSLTEREIEMFFIGFKNSDFFSHLESSKPELRRSTRFRHPPLEYWRNEPKPTR